MVIFDRGILPVSNHSSHVIDTNICVTNWNTLALYLSRLIEVIRNQSFVLYLSEEANVGMCTSSSPSKHVASFLEQPQPSSTSDVSSVETYHGKGYFSMPLKQSMDKKWFTNQTKPTTSLQLPIFLNAMARSIYLSYTEISNLNNRWRTKNNTFGQQALKRRKWQQPSRLMNRPAPSLLSQLYTTGHYSPSFPLKFKDYPSIDLNYEKIDARSWIPCTAYNQARRHFNDVVERKMTALIKQAKQNTI